MSAPSEPVDPPQPLASLRLSERWVRLVFGLTLAVLAVEVVHIYLIRFAQLVHSDAACLVLMAKSSLESRAVIPDQWYWGNGDVWLFATPLAVVPVAVGGAGLETLRVVDLLIFGLELGILTLSYRALTRRTWLGGLAATVTLLGISRLSLSFVYVELAYGFILTTYVAVFVLFASALPRDDDERNAPSLSLPKTARWRWVVGAGVLALIAVSNPIRFLVFGVVPLLAAGVWPWRGVSVRQRAAFGGIVLGGWGLSLVFYRFVFERYLTFSPVGAHEHFVVKDASGIFDNAVMMGRGLLTLSGDSDRLDFPSVPGLLFVLGGMAFVVIDVTMSRTLSRSRFFGVLLLVQLGAVLPPMLVGNLMLHPLSARYVMPAVLSMLGLAVIVTYRRARAGGRGANLARAWLCLAPLVGFVHFARTVNATLETANQQWSNRAGHVKLAKELARRGLRHGFATYWNGNIITLLSNGATQTCPVFIGDTGFVPQKWGVDSTCFDPKRLPHEVYFVANAEERQRLQTALRASFPEPREHFFVDTYEVSVIETAKMPLDWLDLPIPAGKLLRFPFRLAATHSAIQRGHAELVAKQSLIATGEPGTIVFGPHLAMLKGHYRVSWLGSGLESPGRITFDAYAATAGILAVESVAASSLLDRKGAPLMTLRFALAKDTQGLELRVHSEGGGKLRLDELRVEEE